MASEDPGGTSAGIVRAVDSGQFIAGGSGPGRRGVADGSGRGRVGSLRRASGFRLGSWQASPRRASPGRTAVPPAVPSGATVTRTVAARGCHFQSRSRGDGILSLAWAIASWYWIVGANRRPSVRR
jgi:hypothetical protein